MKRFRESSRRFDFANIGMSVGGSTALLPLFYFGEGKKMRLRKIVILLALAAMLLCLLSACGQSQNGISYRPENEDHYTAVHNIPTLSSTIYALRALNSDFCFVTYEQIAKNTSYPTRLIAIDPKSGEIVRYQSLYEKLKKHASDRKQDCTAIIGAAAGSNGNVSAAVCFSNIYSGDPFGYLISLDSGGNVLWELGIGGICSYYDLQSLLRTDDGWTYLLSGSGELMVVDAEGNLAYTNEGGFHHMTRLLDGRIVLFQQSMAGDVWTVLQPDLEAGKMQTLCTLPCLQEGDPRNGGFYTGNSEYDLFCTTDLSLYGIKLGTEDKSGTATQILSWINCDVDGTGILAFAALEDKSFSVLTYSDDMGADLAFLEWSEVDPNAEKTTLTLACRQLPEALSRAIQKFNRQSADCRVVVRDYTTMAASGIDRLTTDLNAGNMPDLFCMEGVDEQTLVNKGYLEDLWPYIDNDEQLDREALVQPAFDAMSVDGKLYTVTRGFTLESTLGLKALVGDEPGWSFAEFDQLVKNTPDLESYGNIYFDRSYALDQFLELYTGNYINWEAEEAYFDSPEFIEAMEYLMLYPEEVNRRRGDAPNYWMPEGKELFTRYELRRLWEYESAKISRVGHSDIAVWKGYPGLGGNGSAIHPQLQSAMASTGEHKEAAWSFLRTMLLPENQDFYRDDNSHSASDGFPTNKAVFDEMVQNYIEPWSNENYTRGAINNYGEKITIDPWTQEDIDAFYALIEGATVVVRPQETIAAILRDEINRFFAGQQDAQTAAKAIQNRVQLCLDEQK